ncbi:hypothetical protein TNCV_572091 [Trichonephila clavipes]|nr:hypothetical protein TNCV_572091 [Trichonephila clavipes]
MITSYVVQDGLVTERKKDIHTSKSHIMGFCHIVAKGVVCWGAIIEEEGSFVVSCIKQLMLFTDHFQEVCSALKSPMKILGTYTAVKSKKESGKQPNKPIK